MIPKSTLCLGPFFYGYIIEVLPHPSEPETIFARSDVGGLLISRNGGDSWDILYRGVAPSLLDHPPKHRFAGDYVYHGHLYDGRYACSAFAIDPHDHNHMLMATGFVGNYVEESRQETPGVAFGELYQSRDAGGNWTRISDQFVLDAAGGNSRTHGNLIAFHPQRQGEVWMATSFDGLFVSKDGATTWRYVGLRGRNLHKILFDPQNPDRLVIAISVAPSYWGIANAGGLAWVETTTCQISEEPSLAGKNVRGLTLHAGGWLAACNIEGIWVSKGAGHAFEPICNGLDLSLGAKDPLYMSWNTVAVDPRQPGNFYASAFKSFSKSKDHGKTWETRHAKDLKVDISGTHVDATEFGSASSSILVSPHHTGRIYLTDFYGVWRSDDDGASWRACREGLVNTCSKRLYALRSSKQESRVAALMTDGGIKISDAGANRVIRVSGQFNAGALAKPIETPEEVQQLSSAASSLAQHPHDTNILYACQNSGQHGIYGMGLLLKSEDAGATWKPANKGLPRGLAWFRDVVVDPFRPSTVLLTNGFKAHQGGGIYRSLDDGSTWELIHNEILCGSAAKAGSAPGVNPLSHLTERDRSHQGVDFYSQVRSSLDRSLIADPQVEGRYYTANRIAGVFQSNDRCETFTDITANLPLLQCPGLASMHFSPSLGKLLVGTYGQGVWVRESETLWTRLDTGRYRSATAFAEDPNGRIYTGFSAHWYAPSDAGILLSDDGGATWQVLDTSWLPNHLISCLAADEYEPILYIGTIGNGLYKACLE